MAHAEKHGYVEPRVIFKERLTGEHTHYRLFAVSPLSIDLKDLPAEPDPQWMDKDVIEDLAGSFGRPLVIVAASTGTDTHTMGIDAICNLKGWNGEQGLEAYKCFEVHNLGSQVQNADLVAAAERLEADAVLVSATVTQQDLHVFNLRQLARMVADRGAHEGVQALCIVGGADPKVQQEARALGFDAGFGKGTYPNHVATTIVRMMCERRVDLMHETADRAFAHGGLKAVA